MAQIIPAGWRELAVTGAALREIETLSLFERGLPDDYLVYHGVHWTRIDKGFSAYGEIDFIVLAPSGRVLLIEQKSGFLDETPDGLVKKYQGKAKNVRNQIMRAVQNLMTRFSKTGEVLAIDYLLYCPDYQVKQPHRAGIEPARIVDAARRDQLIPIVRELLPLSEPAALRQQVMRFLGDTLDLTPDASAMIGRAGEMVTRLSGGLATWARQLEFSPFRLRVSGTAGSGKTQLALAEFRAAVEAGRKPLYVCYNRPLADHVQRLVPAAGRVASFHLLCDAFLREQGAPPDYRRPGVFAEMEQAFARAAVPPHWQFDTLIVDEGQDFSETWRDALLRLLKPEGRALWLEDPMQNLYGRAPVALDGWVTLRAASNYRSPRQIVELLGNIGAADATVEAASPFLGADVDFLTYRAGDTADMYDKTKQAITQCLGAGFARTDIVLLSFRGREKSALLHLDRLGKHALKSFTGEYDLFGNPVFRDGELLTESVYRFKGQSAPAIIFTEIDFEQLDDRTLRKLFVGMTRARLKLCLVLSEPAATMLLARL
jgi:hypothetical protein